MGPADLSFAQLLRRHRLEAGLTQEALSARSGLSVHTISTLERGVRQAPRPSTIVRLTEAMRLGAHEQDMLVRSAAQPARPLFLSRSATRSIPRELPRPIGDFTGRTQELAILREYLDAGGPTCVIDGMGGVGKSALAIRAAHGAVQEDRYPDGQLYVNLRGSTVGVVPMEPAEALGRMLRALGIEPATIPDDLDAAAHLLRSLAAVRRLLIVLDNASSAAQIGPLLPCSGTCAVLVTSRQPLMALEGASLVHLDVLPHDQALDLLGRIAGRERIAAGPRSAAIVVERCGRLPLAIRIAGARLAGRPGWPTTELARRLADAAHRLEALRADGLAVRTCFDVSMQELETSSSPGDREAATAFGLLSAPDGQDIGTATAARLLGMPVPATTAVLQRLVDAQLLDTPRPGRFAFHDLVRLYARERASLRIPAPERAAALARALTFYSATAWHTLALLRPGAGRLATADARWTVGGLEFQDVASALDWLETERGNLLAAIEQAAASEVLGEAAVRLTEALFGFFDLRAYWHDWARMNELSLHAARRSDDLAGQARLLTDLGIAYSSLGRDEDGVACQEEALAISRQIGDLGIQAVVLGNLGIRYSRLGRREEAIICHRASIAAAQRTGDLLCGAHGLINLGNVYLDMDRFDEAIQYLEQGLTICRDLGHQQAQAACLNTIGTIHGRMGRHREAVESIQQGYAIFRELGDRYGQASCQRSLGLEYAHLGRFDEAIASLGDSLARFQELGARSETCTVQQQLEGVMREAGGGQV